MQVKLLIVYCALIWAIWEAQAAEYSLLSSGMEANRSQVTSPETTILFGDGNFFLGDEAVGYDLNTSMLYFHSPFRVMKGESVYLEGSSLEMNPKENQASITDLYLEDVSRGFWASAEQGCFMESEFNLTKALFSSCDPVDPDWYLAFSRGTYDPEKLTLGLHHPILYFHDVPVAYLPYLSANFNKKRRSGFLMPVVGYSEDEGLFIKQPFYYAPDPNWDLEISPQLRTERGYGVMNLLRFVDTPYSNGYFEAGYFQENDRFKNAYDLRNKDHWGFRVKYESRSVFDTEFDWIKRDGLYLDGRKLNDIDYLNIFYGEDKKGERERLVTSYFNYFIDNDRNYAGLYSRYFIDTSENNNDATLQLLPQAHYHRYYDSVLDSIFDERLIFNLDMHYKNHTRDRKLTAQQYEISAPISLFVPLFDEYLTFGASQYFYMTQVDYDDLREGFKDGHFIRTYHELMLQSELIKPYEDFLHEIKLEAIYTKPGLKEKEGFFADFVPLPREEEQLRLNFTQYFFDLNDFLYLSQKIEQPIYFDNYEYKYGDLESELVYRFDEKTEISQDVVYSHDYSKVTKAIHIISTELDEGRYSLSHYYRDDEELEKASFFIAGVEQNLGGYNLFGRISYDYRDNDISYWEAGFERNKRCLRYKVGLKRETTPILTTAGTGYKEESSLYFELALLPLGAAKHTFHGSERGYIPGAE